MQKQADLFVVTVAKKCARISLLLGICIFLAFAIAIEERIMVLGGIFLLVAFMVNGLILLILMLHLLGPKINHQQIFRAIVIMLVNIPIAIFFAWLSIQIANSQHINI
ncbi:MAG: hypothetical protein REI64_13185 [Pedobacter sp.]|nr:hypothetical protein [Pedobacter sp.]